MGFNKKVYNSFKNIGMITQLTISLLTPCFLCIIATVYLRNRFALGDWIVITGILFGLATGFVSVSTFAKSAMKDAEKSQKEYEDKFR
ncbi:MAG: AtpZ/AtpI family protein [Oscillospiraceae bacterium]